MMNPYPLWSGDALPKSAEIPVLDGVAFSVIQPYQPEVDDLRQLVKEHMPDMNWRQGQA